MLLNVMDFADVAGLPDGPQIRGHSNTIGIDWPLVWTRKDRFRRLNHIG